MQAHAIRAEAQQVVMKDYSDRADGPEIIAVQGSANSNAELQLGTREVGWHRHVRGQLFCVESGLMHVRTHRGSWLMPPHRAGWIPPGEVHRAAISGVMSGWFVLVAPEQCIALPDRPCVVGISNVMRALVERAVTWPERDHLSPERARMVAVLLDELRHAPHEPLHLPLPTDRRLVRIAQGIFRAPDDTRTLDAWAEWAGVSPRTINRLFLAETGIGFAQWRRQARLVHALERLAAGEPVANVADALGYASPSNFIAMFRQYFGESPARYFGRREAAGAASANTTRPAGGKYSGQS